MRIGFDAKRAFHNTTGLGNYSRTLIQSLAEYYPEHQYAVFNPTPSTLFSFTQKNIHEIHPSSMLSKLLPGAWRSRWIVEDIQREVDLYHGLSHELPKGINRLSIPSVVTMHDLIFEHFPEQYKWSDVLIYRRKFKYACAVAQQIVAISEATKQDLISLYHIPERKIKVCYQACDQRFYTRITPSMQKAITQKYKLPERYWLSVGSIIERKNLLRVIQAYQQLQQFDIPLVVVGKGTDYKKKLQQYIHEHQLTQSIIFLEDQFASNEIHQDLPGIYQLAIAVLYPSIMEGFGLPVIEAMASGTPVITSKVSSMKEIGQEASLLVNPLAVDDILQAMTILLHDEEKRHLLIQKGTETALAFTPKKTAETMLNLYKTLL